MATNLSSLIWSIAELLRGPYRPNLYGKVILPFTVLRRLECVLEETKQEALRTYEENKELGEVALAHIMSNVTGQSFYNFSRYDLKTLLGDPTNIRANLNFYIQSFSPNARDIFDRFKFAEVIETLDAKERLYLAAEQFAAVDLHPNAVSNIEMGNAFEELIRKFSELSNEEAGQHFTPREVIKLMVNLLFTEDGEALSKPGVVRSLYDPTAGTGGMLSVADEHLRGMNPEAKLVMYGQDFDDEAYAICKADMLIKGQDVSNIKFGDILNNDGHPEAKFDYMLSNPPFGVDWKSVQKDVQREAEERGFAGRFGAGLPRVSDGSLLFLMHLLSKMRPATEGGSRIGIVLNGSPLFTGGAGSGESEIRKWIIENDWLEAIVGLPNDMFFNTGIATYVWILTNHKHPERKGKIQLISGSDLWQKMKKSLGSKRKELGEEHIEEITRVYDEFADGERSRIFENRDFGYSTITVERPLMDESGMVQTDKSGKPKSDSSLRDTENVPLSDDIGEYFRREVLPHVSDAWIDQKKTKIGYEIPFTRHFYQYQPPRPLVEIDADLKAKTARIMEMLRDVTV